MDLPPGCGLSKAERLCGKTAVSALMSRGRWGSAGALKFCALLKEDGETTRIIASVPKKFFKRAVKRNLLKRRIREGFRTQKSLLGNCSADILFSYNSSEIFSSAEVSGSIADALTQISGWKR